MSLPVFKLGKLPKPDTSRLPQLARYVDETLPAAPTSLDYSAHVSAWPMFGNDTLGDCTCAAAGHMVQAWTSMQGKLVTPSLADVEGLYWATGKQDTGRVEADVLKYWSTKGFAKDKIAAFAEVNPKSKTLVKQATWLFGGLYLGVALPISAQTQTIWSTTHGPGTDPGSWGGHAIPVVSYDANYLTIVTWGSLKKLTWAFFEKYVDEAWAILSQDWANSTGNLPNCEGFNWTQLQSDMKAV